MKKVCPKEDQKAISKPNSKNRHSARINCKVGTAGGIGMVWCGEDCMALWCRGPTSLASAGACLIHEREKDY